MQFLKRLFGLEREKVSEPGSSKLMGIDQVVEQYEELFDGWQFSATLSTKTPLEWLLRHGERSEHKGDVPTKYGIWHGQTKTFRELGFDVDEVPAIVVSQIGPIPADGGEFLPFLIEFRKIVESGDLETEIVDALIDLEQRWPEISENLGGNLAQGFLIDRFRNELQCGSATARKLIGAGFTTVNSVRGATLSDLTKVKGIGAKTAENLLKAH